MPKFPTREWVEAFCRALNDSPEYRSAAARWEGDIIFLATNLPQELGLGEKSAMKLLLKHGRCNGVEYYQGSDVDKADAPYILEADYKTWLEVIGGRLQPIPAMVLGKIKIKKGSLSILAQYITAALAMIKAAQVVET